MAKRCQPSSFSSAAVPMKSTKISGSSFPYGLQVIDLTMSLAEITDAVICIFTFLSLHDHCRLAQCSQGLLSTSGLYHPTPTFVPRPMPWKKLVTLPKGISGVDLGRFCSYATGLTQLIMEDCRKIDFSQIGRLVNLRCLEFSRCHGFKDISPIKNLPELHSLQFRFCGISDIYHFDNLRGLCDLSLCYCEGIRDISAIANLSGLCTLRLSGCYGIDDFSPIGNLTELTSLWLDDCVQLTDLSVICNLSKLENLDLSGCVGLEDIALLKTLSNLRDLDISHCPLITDISPISNHSGLLDLDLGFCIDITDISPIGTLLRLQVLILDNCSKIEDASVISKLTRIFYLDTTNCPKIKDFCLSKPGTIHLK
jgi:Leucine-rich repeat (LRR) protein